jgi:hypothetical protein
VVMRRGKETVCCVCVCVCVCVHVPCLPGCCSLGSLRHTHVQSHSPNDFVSVSRCPSLARPECRLSHGKFSLCTYVLFSTWAGPHRAV